MNIPSANPDPVTTATTIPVDTLPGAANAAAGGKSATIEFDNNLLLPLLFGDHDRNLVRLEKAMGVRVSSRGNRVSIAGDPALVQAARGALVGMYKKLERGEPLSRGDFDGAVRLAQVDDPRIATRTETRADTRGDPRLPLADLPAIRTKRGAVGPRSPGQATYMEMLSRMEMVFGIGPAGTGKTYLAVAQAVAMLQAGLVDRIVLSRPAVEAGERLGFLPGDLKEKIDPYLRPLYDALGDMMPGDQVARRFASGEIEVAPLAFMRGRTLSHAFVILDEAQNTTPVQMKMFLTRMGEGTRMVVTGDLSQVDLPTGQRSGLRDALDTLEGVPGIGVCRFAGRDVVRHPLVAAIVGAYEQRVAAQRDARMAQQDGDGPGQ